MKMHQLSRSYLFLFFAIVASVALPLTALADDAGTRTFHIKGIAITGANDVCGEPQWLLPAPLQPTLHGTFVGEYNPAPDAVDALPLTPTNCDDDILVATTVDQVFNAAVGVPDADPRIKNIPLREVPIIVAPDGLRSAVPPLGAVPPNPFPPTKSNPNDPITLGAFLSARGHMTIKCKADGSASVKISFRNLIPNGVYSMWAAWKTTPPGAPGPTLVPLPLGGVPNALVPDKHGRATFKRDLDLCPMDPAPDGSQLLFADLAYHSDSNLYGAVPEMPFNTVEFRAPDGTIFSSALTTGPVTHDQVGFPITVSSVIQE